MADKARSDLPDKPDDEIAAPDPDARKEFDAREEYRGFKMPRGMSLPQRRAWRKSIDEREVLFRRPSPGTDEQLEPTAFQRKFPRYADDVFGATYRATKKQVKDTAKEMFKEAEVLPELGKTVGGALIDAATVVPRTKAAIQSDPKGSLEFVGKAFSGDREAGKELATKASEGIAEPFSTMGDVALAKYAAEEGDYGTAALYGGLILAPAVLQTLGKSLSKGWLKSAAEAGEEIPDEAAKKMNDLAKRVDEGKVTDDTQIRRELAQIEDDHAADYYGGSPSEEMSRIQEDNFGDLDALKRRDHRRSLYTKEGVDAADLEFVRALYTKKTFPQAMEVVERRFMTKSEPFKRVMASEIAGVRPSIEDLRALTSIEADELKSRFVRQLRRTDQEAQQFMDRLESLKKTDKPPGGGTPGGGGRSIDDIEGPSEAEIQQMIEQGRFGDPEQLEILKEDMRRMAELEQGAQIESGRVRSTRTPGAPGASGKIPEGTSRAERKGGKRERPKPKTKKDKYEN